MGITYAEIGCRNLSASLDFYRGMLGLRPLADPPGPTPPGVAWLDAGPAGIRLVERPDGDLAGGEGDDLQRGIRHVGFRVGSVPRYAERLADAGVEFTLGPFQAPGDVWIAFFRDPDGANLEIIDRHLTYTTVVSPDLAEEERRAAARRGPDAGPSFDHVAITVADLDRTLAFYRDRLGYRVIGGLDQPGDPRGFRIHFLRAGAAVLEIFSFTAPPRTTRGTPTAPGSACAASASARTARPPTPRTRPSWRPGSARPGPRRSRATTTSSPTPTACRCARTCPGRRRPPRRERRTPGRSGPRGTAGRAVPGRPDFACFRYRPPTGVPGVVAQGNGWRTPGVKAVSNT